MPQIISVVGNSKSGKTTFIEKLITELTQRKLRVGVIKHTHHGFDADQKGKDTWRHKKAGAEIVIAAAPGQIMMLKDDPNSESIDDLETYFKGLDLVITEGFKKKNRPKIEIFRPEIHKTPVCLRDPSLVAFVSDSDMDVDVPRFKTDAIRELSDFIVDRFVSPRPKTG
ncbi:MAG: molybdopterin-guanine dinucleotide biosynthesis protein B [Deltaproteobacteria bacterium]|nr:molybdopterin-guanine dinucleotide biosynthesis protein B [Deltaproteobacteria bacterium]